MTALEDAARAAQHAPSVFNTQPWSWRVTGDTMDLFADVSRRLDTVDRDGRLLLLSCGAALHHARVTLAAAGHPAVVERIPDPARPELLARVRLGEPAAPDAEAQRLADAITIRRTDRRAFGPRPVPEEELTALRRLVEAEGAYLHVVRPEQLPELAVTAELAARAEQADPAYRAELGRWTSRPDFAGDGVPATTAVRDELRRVPVRDFAPDGDAGLDAGTEHDQGAAYVVLFGTSDEPADLLRGGEALSALLLRATADGLSTAPLSDAIEVEWPRNLLRGMLAGLGDPYLVVRLGYLPANVPLPRAPRRDPRDVITLVE
ncbi:Acg family FMN-binding oxidoreductase [Paractinoplanes toevensis]|uniref:NAD(P)H nitroreductase n=1 Tax=Paractinoplanes toevensis TaxID=571911 RepID=A0A919T3P6_9ACTN|nr:nitroreductase [Actinoplanes toevensis]GIM88318.1 NAD(P)H nitroreductase [Actinoplanes toevensis]